MQAFFSAPRSWRRTGAADAFPQFLEVEAGSGEPLFEFLRNGTSLLKETSEQIAQMRPTATAARIRLRVPAAPDSGSERLLAGKGLAAEPGASASHADSVDASHGRQERAQKLARFTFIQRHGSHGVVRLGYFRPHCRFTDRNTRLRQGGVQPDGRARFEARLAGVGLHRYVRVGVHDQTVGYGSWTSRCRGSHSGQVVSIDRKSTR